MLDFELLRAFVAVADCGGFHRAAERLNLTQSTISQQIKRLELETKRALFRRTTRSVALTDDGEMLLGDARRLLQLDKSYGADGMATRSDVASIKDLKGKTVAASAPGTAPYFTLAWMLKKNGLSVKDVTVVNLEPAAAAQAFVAGQNDAAMTYEPYLSTVRAAPDKGKIIATTLDYPMIMDTFGCTPKFLADNPKATQALADSYFEAVALIEKDQAKSYESMGSDVKQSGEQFGNSAKYLRWQDKAANQKFFAGEFQAFTKEAGELLLEIGIIKSIPKIDDLVDTSFIK